MVQFDADTDYTSYGWATALEGKKEQSDSYWNDGIHNISSVFSDSLSLTKKLVAIFVSCTFIGTHVSDLKQSINTSRRMRSFLFGTKKHLIQTSRVCHTLNSSLVLRITCFLSFQSMLGQTLAPKQKQT